MLTKASVLWPNWSIFISIEQLAHGPVVDKLPEQRYQARAPVHGRPRWGEISARASRASSETPSRRTRQGLPAATARGGVLARAAVGV